MTLSQELASFWAPKAKQTNPPPTIGSKAPSSSLLSMPSPDHRPTIITFLRHCGCPFAEKTFKSLRTTASRTPHIRFVAVSHSDGASTTRWLDVLEGSEGVVEIVVDADRDVFASWGLGVSSLAHFLSPAGISAAYRLGKEEGIWNRPTESGNRWQTSGSFAIDGEGTVKWGGPMQRAHEVPDFEEAVKALS